MEEIQTTAIQVLSNLALGVVTLLGAYGMYYIRKAAAKIKAQTQQIKDEEQRRFLENALGDVQHLAELSVSSLEQTTAKALREAVRDGQTDRSELLTLGTQVLWDVKRSVAPEAQRVIAENLGDFDAYLTKCIEDAVRRVKQEDPYITLPAALTGTGT